MATKVVMEALSPTMEEGRLVEWKKQPGDAVAVGDVLAEVETDKAVMELAARVGGTLLRHTIEEGATVPVSAEVALIGSPGEEIPPPPQVTPDDVTARARTAERVLAAPDAEATQPSPGRDRPVSMPPAAPARAVTESAPPLAPTAAARATPAAPAPPSGGRLRASPLARRIAAERGLDLARVQGSGPEGRVVARDLDGVGAAPAASGTARGAAVARPARIAFPAEGFTDQPLTQMRRAIARRLVQSIGPIPTFYLTAEADMERVTEARAALLEAAADGPSAAVKVSFNDVILKAVATALRQHPMCNAWWEDDRIRLWHDVHLGVAVAIEDGLITPVIRHADQKSLREIAAEAGELAARARARRLAPDEYTGATFSVSNLGMLGIDEFTAIINPPEAAILAVGRIEERPVAHGGQVALRRRMRMTLSCDHRVIDGATGARFLQTLTGMLENPLALVW
ncbi:MAG TPA: dihydrolipoamide acetyltransferase family protein [Gemmatimonadales bacterium]|nr:dihydrolipoamide acetyltransferase family protein [Gemmatimonadales bacterium]